MLPFQTAMIIAVPVILGTGTNVQHVVMDTVSMVRNVATVIAMTVTWMRLKCTNAHHVHMEKLGSSV